MAYLGSDDKQNQNQQDGAPASGAAAPGAMQAGSGTTPLVGSGGGTVTGSSGPTPTQGPQGGGGTGWTNIQSYLTANQGNSNASDTLSKNVGGAFTQDQTNIGNQAQQTQSQAQNAGKSNYMAPDQASQLLSQASSQYNPAGQTQDYQNTVNQFRNDLTGQYGGPQKNSFNPSLSANTQQYGQALGNDDQLNAIMGNFYNKDSGSNLTTGQMDLQSLLQQNDPNFQQTRQNLTTQYAGLNPWLQQQQQATNDAITNAQTQYTGNQKQLNDYLTGQSTQNKSAIDSQVGQIQNWLKSNTSDYASGPNSKDEYKSTNSVTANNPSGDIRTAPELAFHQTSFNGMNPVTEGNATGVDQQRNAYNTLADIFGSGNKISTDTPYSASNINRHQVDMNGMANFMRLYGGEGPGATTTSTDQNLMQFLSANNPEAVAQAQRLGIAAIPGDARIAPGTNIRPNIDYRLTGQ